MGDPDSSMKSTGSGATGTVNSGMIRRPDVCGRTGTKRRRSVVSPIDKAFRIATPMRKASWTKRFAGGWGERRGANGDGGSGGEGWREWAGGVSEKSLPRRAALEKPRPLWLEDAAQGCRNRRFRSPARQGHGTPKRGYSPRNRVRQLPQWGHRGRAASRSAASSTARSAGSVSSLNASERLDILSGCAASAGVARIKSNQARLDWSRFEGCQSP